MLNFFRDLFCIRFSKPIADSVKVAPIIPLLGFVFLWINIAFPHNINYFIPMLYVSNGLLILSLLLLFFYRYLHIYLIQLLLGYLSFQIAFMAFLPVLANKGDIYFYIACTIIIVGHWLMLRLLISSRRNFDKDNTLQNIQKAMLKNGKPSLEFPFDPDMFSYTTKPKQMGDFQTFAFLGYMIVAVVISYSLFFSSKIFRAFHHEQVLTITDPRQFYLAVIFVYFIYPIFSFLFLLLFLLSFKLFLEAARRWRLSQKAGK